MLLILIVSTVCGMWMFFGMLVLLSSEVSVPKNIKQYVFHSMITGPIGALIIGFHCCVFTKIPNFCEWVRKCHKTLD